MATDSKHGQVEELGLLGELVSVDPTTLVFDAVPLALDGLHSARPASEDSSNTLSTTMGPLELALYFANIQHEQGTCRLVSVNSVAQLTLNVQAEDHVDRLRKAEFTQHVSILYQVQRHAGDSRIVFRQFLVAPEWWLLQQSQPYHTEIWLQHSLW